MSAAGVDWNEGLGKSKGRFGARAGIDCQQPDQEVTKRLISTACLPNARVAAMTEDEATLELD
jgi:hypothetical protein